jgi:Cu-processing system ATP-binding protein
VIEVHGLRKTYGPVTALHGLDARLRAGLVTAIVGPNGSGKTTLIKALLGLVRPDAGEIRLCGTPVGEDPAYRGQIGYMPQEPAFPGNLRVAELFALVDDLRGGPGGDDGGLAERLGVPDLADRSLGGLSGGMRQKVSAALAFRYDPAILVLDEPTAGLDPIARAILKDAVRAASAAGRTVLVTSHVLTELEDLSDDLLFLVDGRARFAGEVRELLALTGARRLEQAVVRLMERRGGPTGADDRPAGVPLRRLEAM